MTYSTRSLLVIIVLGFTAYINFFVIEKLHEMPLEQPLDTIPVKIGGWTQIEGIDLDKKIIDMLGVDDYIEKVYISENKQSIDFYASYFSVLKEGKQFHSPKNCLIGSGSILIRDDVVNIPINRNGEVVPVGFMLLQKGDSRQLILYWYQCRGRIMYSEYEERIYRVIDAIFKKRTDGAFVRIIATDNDGDIQDTYNSIKGFASQIIPILTQQLPGV